MLAPSKADFGFNPFAAQNRGKCGNGGIVGPESAARIAGDGVTARAASGESRGAGRGVHKERSGVPSPGMPLKRGRGVGTGRRHNIEVASTVCESSTVSPNS